MPCAPMLSLCTSADIRQLQKTSGVSGYLGFVHTVDWVGGLGLAAIKIFEVNT